MIRCVRLVALSLLATTPAATQAQRPDSVPTPITLSSGIAVFGTAVQSTSVLRLDDTRESISGSWVGGRLLLWAGPLVIDGSYTGGVLDPEAGATTFSRDGGEARGIARINLVPQVGLEGGFTLRTFESPVGFQRWTIPSVGAHIAGQLGTPDLLGFVRGHYLPGVKVSGQQTPDLGLLGEAGLIARITSTPFIVRLDYRIERFDFPTGTVQRTEHFQSLSAALGLMLGRR